MQALQAQLFSPPQQVRSSAARKPFGAIRYGALLASSHRQRHLAVSAKGSGDASAAPITGSDGKNAVGAALQDNETRLLSTTSNKTVDDAVALLRDAAKTRAVPADDVVGALLLLEQNFMNNPNTAGVRDLRKQLEAEWKLTFTSATIPQMRYIPVQEAMTCRNNRIELYSNLGPSKFSFSGDMQYNNDGTSIGFAFSKMNIELFGRSVVDKSMGGSEKTYVFFHMDDAIACARSTGGGVILLQRL